MSDLTPKGFSNGNYVNRFLLRDKLYEEDAITMGGVAILNNFPAADVTPVVRCGKCKFRVYGGCSLHDIWRGENFYCADGEKRNSDV